jgi:hypothetical protein
VSEEKEKVKRPAFQFYPGDWLRSTDLRTCSIGARGLWIDMICLMHEGYPYGYLKVGGKVILPDNLSRIVGATLQEVEGWLHELEVAGVFSRDQAGVIFSRRMVRDEKVRENRGKGGVLGGNPTLKDRGKDGGKVTPKVGDKVNLPANLQPTPASASADAYNPLNPPKGENSGNRDVFIKAWDAFSKWSVARTKFPLGLGHNQERHIQKLIAGLEGQPPIIQGGRQIAQELLIPLAVQFHIDAGTQWKSIQYACGCVRSKLDEWAKEPPAESNGPKPPEDRVAIDKHFNEVTKRESAKIISEILSKQNAGGKAP